MMIIHNRIGIICSQCDSIEIAPDSDAVASESFAKLELRSSLAPDLKRAVADIRANRGLEEDTNRHLGIGGLGPELKVSIA